MDQSKKQAAAEARRLQRIKENEARAAAEEARFAGRNDPDKGLGINADIIALWYRTWAAYRSESLKPFIARRARNLAKKAAFPEYMSFVAFEAYRTSGLVLGAGPSPTEIVLSWQPQPGAPGAFSHLLTNERLWLFDGASHRCFAFADIRDYKARTWPALVFFYLNRVSSAVVVDRQGRTWKFRKLGNILGRGSVTKMMRIGPFPDPPEGPAERAAIQITACGVRCPQCQTDVRLVMGRSVVLCPQCRTLLELCPRCSSPKLQASQTDFEQLKSLAPGLLVGGLIGGIGGQMAVSQGIDAMGSAGGSMRKCLICLHTWKSSPYL